MPYIGANGNWYVENEDTGMKAQGPMGAQGPAGAGVQGLIGPKGETGDRGPQGVKGDTPKLADNLTTTIPGAALDATMGKVLDERIEDTLQAVGRMEGRLGAQIKRIVYAGSGYQSIEAGETKSITLDISTYGFQKKPEYFMGGIRQCTATVTGVTSTALTLQMFGMITTETAAAYIVLMELE